MTWQGLTQFTVCPFHVVRAWTPSPPFGLAGLALSFMSVCGVPNSSTAYNRLKTPSRSCAPEETFVTPSRLDLRLRRELNCRRAKVKTEGTRSQYPSDLPPKVKSPSRPPAGPPGTPPPNETTRRWPRWPRHGPDEGSRPPAVLTLVDCAGSERREAQSLKSDPERPRGGPDADSFGF